MVWNALKFKPNLLSICVILYALLNEEYNTNKILTKIAEDNITNKLKNIIN
jgi:hypothetical protein